MTMLCFKKLQNKEGRSYMGKSRWTDRANAKANRINATEVSVRTRHVGVFVLLPFFNFL